MWNEGHEENPLRKPESFHYSTDERGDYDQAYQNKTAKILFEPISKSEADT